VEGDALLLVLRQLVDQPGPLKTRIPERHGGPGQVFCTWVSAIVVVRPMRALHCASVLSTEKAWVSGRAETRVGFGGRCCQASACLDGRQQHQRQLHRHS
jgi:hypothetical protein